MGETIKKAIISGFKILVKPIVIILIASIVVSLFFFASSKETVKNASKIFEDVKDNVKISGNNIEIDQDYLQQAKKKLEKMGIDSTTLGLLGNNDYLERFLEAEIITSYPNLGGDGLQGAVYFERYKLDGSTQYLKYIDKDTFYSKQQNGESDLYDYFTVDTDTDDWTVHVTTMEGKIEKINYKSMVEKYAMPFEFPMSLALISQNPQFALAVVNLVKKSRIVIAIAESKTTITTTNTLKYRRIITRYSTTANEDGSIKTIISDENVTNELEPDVEEVYSTDIYLARANTWILNEVTDIQPDNSTENDEPIVTELSSNHSSIREEDGSEISIDETERTNTKEVERQYQRWVRGTSEVIDNVKNFTNLILRDGSTIDGDGIVAIAKQCHDAIAQSGRFTYGGTSGGIPIDVNTDTKVDCSGFVSWVLYEAGYKDLEGAQHSSADSSFGAYGDSKGWERIKNIDDVQPGDICFWADADGPYHVNICAKKEAQTYYFYDCGSNSLISSIDPTQWSDMEDFYYAFRPNDEIAQALSPTSEEELEDQIREYIKSAEHADFSISVKDLTSNKSFKINNKEVTSNGWLKIFIMATTYDEVRQGNINEEDVSSEIDRMITADDTGAANSLLKKLGKGDLEEGIKVVSTYLRKYGYGNTKIEGELQDEDESTKNHTTVEDVTKIMEKIFGGKCVNGEYSEKMLECLSLQNYTNLIPSQILDGNVSNKTGAGVTTRQDTAIVSLENANYIISISATNVTDIVSAENDIQTIAKLVNDYFSENGKLINNNYYQVDDEIETILQGRKVCYKLYNGKYRCPLDNLVEGREMLFDILGDSEKTQSHEKLMRYILYLLTGRNFGVTEFDFNEFLNGSFNSVGGIYGNTPQEKVWWAVIDAGYSKEAAAGVLGNIEAESGFNESAIEAGNGIGLGLCQWSFGRRTQLENYAASKGVSASDLDTQIEFLIGEITPGGGANGYATYQLVTYNGYSAEDWKRASTPEDAAVAFCWSFERPGIPRMSVRTEAARKYYEQFKDAARPSASGIGNEIQNRIVDLAVNHGGEYNPRPSRCLAWVDDIYEAAGLSVVRRACASEAANANIVSTDTSNIPIGATVYGWSTTITYCGSHNAGHVGIYIGNGQIISNAGGRLWTCTIDQWKATYSFDNSFRGWGWECGTDISK